MYLYIHSLSLLLSFARSVGSRKRTLFEFKFDRTHGLKHDDAAEATLFFFVPIFIIIRETSGERK